MNVQNQIHRLENILANGYTKHSTIKGTSEAYVQNYAFANSVLIRPKEKKELTPGRRRMLEQQIKRLKSCEKFLWITAAPETTIQEVNGKSVPITVIKRVQGTYNRRLHGELKSKR